MFTRFLLRLFVEHHNERHSSACQYSVRQRSKWAKMCAIFCTKCVSISQPTSILSATSTFSRVVKKHMPGNFYICVSSVRPISYFLIPYNHQISLRFYFSLYRNHLSPGGRCDFCLRIVCLREFIFSRANKKLGTVSNNWGKFKFPLVNFPVLAGSARLPNNSRLLDVSSRHNTAACVHAHFAHSPATKETIN